MRYFVLRHGASTAEGPFEEEEIRERFSGGSLDRGDLVAPVGSTSGADWKPVETLLGATASSVPERDSPPPVPPDLPVPQPPGAPPETERPKAASPKETGGVGRGCAIGCALIFGILFALAVAAYFVVMHTSIPLRAMARAIEAEEDVEFQGVSGTLASASFSVEKILFKEVNGHRPEINQLVVKGSGLRDFLMGNFTFEEISVKRARFYGWQDLDVLAWFSRQGPIDPEFDGNHVVHELRSDPDAVFRVESFEISDVVYENLQSGKLTSFDSLVCRGLEVRGSGFDPGEITIHSDWLDVETLPPGDVETDGERWTATRRYRGVVKPAIDPWLTQPIDIESAVNAEDITQARWHFSAFDGKLQSDHFPADRRRFRCLDLDFDAYFQIPNVLLPEAYAIEVESARQPGSSRMEEVRVLGGSFQFGRTTFRAVQRVYHSNESETTSPEMRAEITVDERPIAVSLYRLETPDGDGPWGWKLKIQAEPPLDRRLLLSHLWFGQAPLDLTPFERAQLEASQRFYFDFEPLPVLDEGVERVQP